MPTFTCLITDRRYSAPTLVFRDAPDEERARRLARQDLEANPDHQVFEVHEGERMLFAEFTAPEPPEPGLPA